MNNKILFILAIIAFFLYQIINFLYFPLHTIYPDEGRFVNEAIKFANSGEFWTGNARAWEMPLIGILYGIIYKIANNQEHLVTIVRVFQSLLVILNAYLIYKISLIIFRKRIVSLVAYIIMLFYPFFLYYQGLLLSETIFNTFLLLGFYFLYKWYDNNFNIDKNFIFANIFLILSLYVKATLTILPFVLITIFYFINKRNLKNSLIIFTYSFGIWIMLLSAWWIRNYIIFNKFVVFTTSSGVNLYLGNNKCNLKGGIDWGKDVNKTFVKEVSKLSELDKNKAFRQKSIEFIKNNPDRFLRLAWMKFKRFYNIEFNNENLKNSKLNIVSILSYGTILVLFLISIVLNIDKWRVLSAIYILFLYFTLLHMVVIASLRYRLPLEAFMILMASYSIYFIYRKIINEKNSISFSS